MTEHQNDPVIQRLDRLERENWYWKRATLLLLIVIGSVIFMGQGFVNSSVPYELVAHRFVLKDDKGQRRAELRYEELVNEDKGGTVTFGLYGKSTPTNAELVLSDGHVYFRINATDQLAEVAAQQASEYDKKYQAAKTPEEQERLGFLPLHRPQVILSAGQDGSRLKLDGREGNATLQLMDRIGTSTVLGSVGLEKTGTGSIEQRPAASIVLLNKDRGVLWKAP